MLLDEHFSWKLSLLADLGYPLRHVQRVQELGEWRAGAETGHGAADEQIAEWCGANDHVLVTTDNDFRAIQAKWNLLKQANLEVILCIPQPTGLQAQVK